LHNHIRTARPRFDGTLNLLTANLLTALPRRCVPTEDKSSHTVDDSDFQHNFHTHTFRCKHAKGDVTDYCDVALERGMKTLGFSDHAALPDDRWQRARMSYEQLADYVAAIDQGREDYPGLKILKGMECEYIADFDAYYADELLGELGFDYLVGGAHLFPDGGKWRPTYGGTDTPENLHKYAAHVIDMMATGYFSFIAHPDLFGNCYADWDADTIACSKDILAASAELGVAMEINALGLAKIAHRKPDNPFPLYPWEPFWELAADYDVKVIINADAHRPQDLQRRTGEAWAIANKFKLTLMSPSDVGYHP
jgi:histidinol-phosphatase (PHP family)